MRAPDAKTWVRIALALFGVAFVTYMILIPAGDAILSSFRDQPKKIIQLQDDMTLAEKIRLRTIEGITAFCFFAFGASIGSFLNVVVYRMPIGESLVFKRSRCPMCRTQISGRDNVPILGWLLLGGRCRTCGDSISLRYPTIELIVGSLFLLLYFVELISGGANLPIRRPNDYAGVVWIVFYTKWDLVTIYLFHCILLSILLTLALIDLDKKRLATKSLAIFALLLAVPACLFPHLLLVKLPLLRVGLSMPTWTQAFATVLAGATSGLLGAIATTAAIRRADLARPLFVVGLMLVGICLGWQAVLATLFIALILKLGSFLIGRWAAKNRLPESAIAEPSEMEEMQKEPMPFDLMQSLLIVGSLRLTMFLFIATVIHHVVWRWLVNTIG